MIYRILDAMWRIIHPRNNWTAWFSSLSASHLINHSITNTDLAFKTAFPQFLRESSDDDLIDGVSVDLSSYFTPRRRRASPISPPRPQPASMKRRKRKRTGKPDDEMHYICWCSREGISWHRLNSPHQSRDFLGVFDSLKKWKEKNRNWNEWLKKKKKSSNPS